MLRKFANGVAGRQTTTLIGINSVLTGDLHFTGALRVEGKIDGSILADPTDHNARLEITRGAVISGSVSVPIVAVHGVVIGNIIDARRVTLGARARVGGDVAYQELEMAVGAHVAGKLTRRPDVDSDHSDRFFRRTSASAMALRAPKHAGQAEDQPVEHVIDDSSKGNPS